MTFGLTTRPVLAAAVAAGQLHMLPWRASRGRLGAIGAQHPAELISRPVLVHGSIAWGEGEQREAARRGLDKSACGRVVARGVVAGFARVRGGHVSTEGSRPSWAPDDPDALLADWPDQADEVVLLDRVEPVAPEVAMGTIGGPWAAASGLVARIAPLGDGPDCPSCGTTMRPGTCGGISDWRCPTCIRRRAADDAAQRAEDLALMMDEPAPSAATVASAPRSLEAAFARAAAAAGVEGWLIADLLPPFGDTWITELRPDPDDKAQPWPAPAITITRQADVVAQARALVDLIPRLVQWWVGALAGLLARRSAPGLVRGCIECEMPSVLLSTSGATVLLEGAGFVDELARPIGTVCSRGRGGCQPMMDTPVACSTACERDALRRARRDTFTATSPPEADWHRALNQRRLWKAAGDAQAADVRRAILIHLAEGTPLPAFTEVPR